MINIEYMVQFQLAESLRIIKKMQLLVAKGFLVANLHLT